MFKSRWKAVFWSAGILLTAYCAVPAADQSGQDDDPQVAAAKAHHKSPWAKD